MNHLTGIVTLVNKLHLFLYFNTFNIAITHKIHFSILTQSLINHLFIDYFMSIITFLNFGHMRKFTTTPLVSGVAPSSSPNHCRLKMSFLS